MRNADRAGGDAVLAKHMSDWTLSDWTDAVWKTFEANDRRRSPMDIWSSAVIYTSTIAEGLRKARYDEVFRGIAHTFVWIASFVAKAANDDRVPDVLRPIDKRFEDIVALMYPEHCGHCHTKPCSCRPLDIEAKPDKKMRVSRLLTERETFRERTRYQEWPLRIWVKLFGDIFAASTHLLPVESIGFHLAEEVGEVAKAIRDCQHIEGMVAGIEKNFSGEGKEEKLAKYAALAQAKRYDLEIEIAQSFSWLCSLFLRLSHILDGLRDPQEERGVGANKEKVVDIHINGLREGGVGRRWLELCDLLIARFGDDGGKKFICDNCGTSPCKCELYLVEYRPVE